MLSMIFDIALRAPLDNLTLHEIYNDDEIIMPHLFKYLVGRALQYRQMSIYSSANITDNIAGIASENLQRADNSWRGSSTPSFSTVAAFCFSIRRY